MVKLLVMVVVLGNCFWGNFFKVCWIMGVSKGGNFGGKVKWILRWVVCNVLGNFENGRLLMMSLYSKIFIV